MLLKRGSNIHLFLYHIGTVIRNKTINQVERGFILMLKARDVVAGPIDERELCKIKEAVCLQAEKVYDSCKEKDCIEDLEVFCIPKYLLKDAIDVACRDIEVENVIIDIEPLRFKKGFYTVTVTFVFKVTVELFYKNKSPVVRTGISIFTKKVVLFGSQGKVKIFKSKFKRGAKDIQFTPKLQQDNLPIGKVEVAEPICLAAKIVEDCEPTTLSARDIQIIKSIIAFIQQNMAEVNVVSIDGGDIDVDVDQSNVINISGERKEEKKVLITVGLFSIIKLVRVVQVLVPSFGFCDPPVCVEATKENPCDFFDTIEFPEDVFFPPQKERFKEEESEEEHDYKCCRQ